MTLRSNMAAERDGLLRHDIVHRAGCHADGTVVDLEVHDLERVSGLVFSFADSLEEELRMRFPPPPARDDNSPF